ncbi:DUF4129 domain-containing transglutaminase family protein [Neobacillus sp. PS3-34]|uniref:DUF4129 domain-containing transglutaminase family protein n=1 Tax=Neobacillus sp. PS3-34 TaxID=3070678 RepID=UPI0027DED4FD|nr:DUF4129 domain-containing transglutaminase family protein [Neobacillus sp. PS3-34]WML50151.1 DUF4129 domain-containing transglutaminase family protein [Neobacillus sp. PS3-34]
MDGSPCGNDRCQHGCRLRCTESGSHVADPVPFIKSLNDKSSEKGSGGVSRIGYGTNDSKLGGPFISDSSIVFTADAESRNYWKVESKDVYTGKGWITTLKSERLNFKSGESVPLEYTPKSVKTEKEHAQINMNILYKHIIYPYGLRIIGTGTLTKFELDQDLEKIYSFGPSKHPEVLRKYSVDFEVPTYRVSELTKVTGKDASQMSQEFITRYTQLPQRLPLRVIQLAEKITADKNNWFDKAKAIESFFNSPEYTYDQKKVAVPGKKDDYVDQFLFETKRGYCDNFSTSMVVMLRSIGIPARWVKGYSSGEFKKYSDTDTSRQIYEISNNNAHSWVEAYFPNQGWIPFEPTKGFSNNIKLNYEIKTTPAGQSEAVPAVAPKKPQPNRLEEMEKKTATSKTTIQKQSMLKRSMKFVQTNWGWILFSLLAVGTAISLLYQIRFRWLPHYFIFLFKWRKKDIHLAKAYLVLLKQLERYGLKRKNDQTLRNYARYVDSFFSSNEMGRLTSRYEQYIYNSNLPAGSWKELKELWENLIKKTIA